MITETSDSDATRRRGLKHIVRVTHVIILACVINNVFIYLLIIIKTSKKYGVLCQRRMPIKF